MKQTEQLIKAWHSRSAIGTWMNMSWWVKHYERAVDRIEDRTDHHAHGDSNPHFFSASNEASACPDGSPKIVGPVIIFDDGSTCTPEQARQMGFELVVLADVADAHWGAKVEGWNV